MQTQTLPETVGIHQSTYDAVFQHPIARNLQWHDIHSMLNSLTTATEESNGNFKFTRNGQTLTIHPPQHKGFSDVEELMHVRHFLERSAATAQSQSQTSPSNSKDFLVVIDHREARIYKTELAGTTPHRITPLDPTDSHRHLHFVEDTNNTGKTKREPTEFYNSVIKALAGAEKILLMGSSTGSSSAMDHLTQEIKENHPDLAKKIIGTLTINEKHMSEDQLLAQARDFYATHP